MREVTQESLWRVRVFRTSDLDYHLSVEIYFFEMEAKDLPHPLNKRRIEFDSLQMTQINGMAITLVQRYALVS